jgi:predicted dehydrogenase
MDKLNFGVIGAGLWGESHARVFSAHPKANLTAICDLDGKKAKNIADKYGASEVYTDYNQMLKNPAIDAVGITTPDFAHAGPFIAACRAGKHILVEKPLATTAEDLSAMKKAFNESGSRVMVDFHARWNPPFAIARDDIRANKIGKIISMYYRLNDCIFVPTEMLSWAAESSILWFLGSHTIDTLRFFTDKEVKSVFSMSRSEVLAGMGIDVPDIYQSMLEFEDGVIASIENGWIIPNTNPNWNDIKVNILGSKGMFNMDLTNNQAIERYLADKSDHPDLLVMPMVHGEYKGFAYESIKDFIEKLSSGDDFICGFDDGYRVSKVILAIMESAEKRIPVDVDYG